MFQLKSPLLLVIDITNDCNLSCSYCFQNFRCASKHELSFQEIVAVLNEAKDMGIFEINICGGEPFKHKDIIKIISKVKEYGFNLSIVTNGTLINRKIANKLNSLDVIKNMQLSFDSHIEEIHNKTRDCFSLSLRGLTFLLETGGIPPSIGTVIHKHNIESIDETINYFYKKKINRFHLMNIIGVDSLSCDTSELNDLQKKLHSKYKNDLSNKQITISSLKEINDTDFQYKSSHINCLAGFTTIVMKSNKEIIPCDMVDHVLYKWEKYGDLEKGFNIGKEKWMNLKCSWCEKCLKY